LKAKGVEFPVLDPDLASETFIPEKVLPFIINFLQADFVVALEM